MLATTSAFPEALLPSHVTILSYGALTSEASARLTFPDLKSFRHVQVKPVSYTHLTLPTILLV